MSAYHNATVENIKTEILRVIKNLKRNNADVTTGEWCDGMEAAAEQLAKEADERYAAAPRVRMLKKKIAAEAAGYQKCHLENEADARAAGYPNLISMQQEGAAEQHPDIMFGTQRRTATHEMERKEREERDHASNLGLIALALAEHTPGDFGDCWVNDVIVNLIDFELPAHRLLQELAEMSRERAAGIVRQCYTPPPERIETHDEIPF